MSGKSVLLSSIKAIESARSLEAILSESAGHIIRYLGNNKEALETLIESGKITDWDTYQPQLCFVPTVSSVIGNAEFIKFSWDGYYSSIQDHVYSSFKINIDTFLELEEIVRNLYNQ